MGKGLSLDIAANTRDFQRGTKDVEKALEEVADSLDDVSRDGDKSADKLARSFSEAQRDISKDAKKIGRDVKKEATDGFDDAGHAAQGFKEEATANFQEVASSFDGSMESLADAAQGTLGGLATAIGGPLGLGLAGLGALGGAFTAQWMAAAEQTKENISDMYNDMLESGQNYLSQDFLNRKTQELIEDEGKMAEIKQTQLRTGLDINTVILAEISAGKERSEVQQALNDKLEETSSNGELLTRQQNYLVTQMQSQVGHYEDLNKQQDDSYSKVQLVRDVWGDIADKTASAAKSSETQGERLQKQADTLNAMPKDITVKVAADTSALDRALAAPRRVTADVYARNGKRLDF